MDQPVHIAELPEYVIIGRISRSHGIRGAIKVEPITDDPGRFQLLKTLYIVHPDGSRIQYHLNGIQNGNRYLILTLAGISTRNDADLLRGCYIEIPRSECLPLPEGSYYYFELIGFSVITNQGDIIGTLKDVFDYPANDIFVVEKDNKELLIPVVDEFIENIDKQRGIITINPVDGLLEQE